MRGIFIIALTLVLAGGGAEANQNSQPAEKPLDLNLNDSGLAQKDAPQSTQDKQFNELQTSSKNDDADPKFELKPEFNFVDDYDPNINKQGEEVKLHLDYNF